MYRRLLLPLLCGTLLFAACDTNSPDDAPTGAVVYVGNQGNFSDGNGSVTVYDPATEQTTPDAISNLNTLVQSVSVTDDRGYIAANTGNRIDVFDRANNSRIAQIADVSSPRYLAMVSDTRAYVTNLFTNSVTILDLANQTATGTIAVGSNPEGLVVVGNTAFVANNGFGADSTISVINTTSHVVEQVFDLNCDGPRFLGFDREDELWVFCTGQTIYNDDFTEILSQTNGTVLVLNPADGTEIKRFDLDAQLGGGASGQDVFFATSAERAYALVGTTVLLFDTDANTQTTRFALAGDDLAGAIAYDATADRLYVARVPSFTDAGYVTILDPSHAEESRFTTGIAPSYIAFAP